MVLHFRRYTNNVRLAFEELRFFSHNVDIMGVYPPDRFRERIG